MPSLSRATGPQKAALLFAAVVALQAMDAVVGLGVFWSHDIRHHHIPWRAWSASKWLAGWVPTWSHQVGNGFPLMADGQAGVFYPVNFILGALFSPERAVTIGLLLHQWWAALGAYFLCRALGHSEGASRLGGVGFALSGFLVSHFTYVGMQHVVSWLPFAVCAVVRLGHGAGWRWGLGWAVSVAAMGTAGHPQAAAIAGLGCLAVCVSAARTRQSWGWLGLGFVVGALAALPQWLATWELAGQSARDGGVDAAFAGIGSLPPQELVNGILPRFWGMETPADIATTYLHKGSGYFGTGESYWEMCFYLGIPIVLLAVFGVLRGGARIWKCMALVALLLMLGRYTPVWGWVRLIPGLDHFRFPVRFAMLLTLSVSVLAARGLDVLHKHLWSAATRRILQGLGTIVVLGTLGVVVVHRGLTWAEHGLVGWLEASLQPRPDATQRAMEVVEGLLASTSLASPVVLWPLFLAISGLLLVRGARKERITRTQLSWFLLMLALVDFTAFGSGFNHRTPSAVAQARPATADVVTGGAGLYRTTVVDRLQPTYLDKELLSASLGLLVGTRDVIVPSPLLLPRNEALLEAAGLDIGADPSVDKVPRLVENLGISELMGVRYLVSSRAIDHPRLQEIYRSAVRVYRNDAAQSRAFVVGCAQVVEGVDQAIEALGELDLRQVAVVERELDLPCGPVPGRAHIAHKKGYSDTRVSVDVEMESPGLLVLTDTHYPGWEVLVNGEPGVIERVNVGFRGVVLEEGRHEVVFRYRPFWRGTIWVGLVAWLMLGLGGVLSLRR